MNNALGASPMDCIVVGRVSLNKKRAKKNLQKIAHAPQQQPAKRVSETRYASSTPAQPVQKVQQTPKIPIPQQVPQVKIVALKPAAAVARETCFTQLPDSVLSLIFTDLQSVGACAAVCRDFRETLWDSEGFWLALGSPGRSVPAREAFRRSHFGLEGDWVSSFQALVAEAEPVTALLEATKKAGGLMAPERLQAQRFLDITCDLTRRCEAGDEAFALLDTLGMKVAEREGSVFQAGALDSLAAAREDLLEIGILARLDAQVENEMNAFDPFEPAPPTHEEWEVDGPLPTLILDVPASEPLPAQKYLDDAEISTDDDSDDFFSLDGSDDEDEDEEPRKLDVGLQDDFLDLLR